MTDEYCEDCNHKFEKGQMRIFWEGKNRCEKCDRRIVMMLSRKKEKLSR